ncbi:MAG: protein TonB [Flavobacteriales bacterium]|jgi:protein TonB
MALMFAPPNPMLPWSSSVEDDKRFFKILGVLSIPFLLLALIIPFYDVPEIPREVLEKIPPRLAQVQLEEQELPPPPPPPEPEPEEEEEPEKKPEEKPEEPEPEPIPVEKEPEPAQLIEEAREVAEAEINQFADALSDMRDAFDLSDVNADLTQSTGEAAELDRSIITSGATSGSGGITTSNMSRNTGGVALSGKENTRVSSKLADATGKATKGSKNGNRDKSFRSDEDIRKVMDQNKGRIYAIYNKALRSNPTLEGKVVFKIVIDANGKVSAASIVSSELDDPALERKLLARLRLINFGVKAVLKTTLNYSFDFLPY